MGELRARISQNSNKHPPTLNNTTTKRTYHGPQRKSPEKHDPNQAYERIKRYRFLHAWQGHREFSQGQSKPGLLFVSFLGGAFGGVGGLEVLFRALIVSCGQLRELLRLVGRVYLDAFHFGRHLAFCLLFCGGFVEAAVK